MEHAISNRAGFHSLNSKPRDPLKENTVLSFLRDQNLLPDLPRDRFSVLDMTRRNRNFAVHIDEQPVWFVKQIRYGVPDVIAGLRREAWCYQIVQKTPTLAALRELMPRRILFDVAESILVTECLNGVDAAEAHVQIGEFDSDLAALLGRHLALVHASSADAFQAGMHALLPAELPWVLQPSYRRDPGSQRATIIAHAEADPETARAMAELRAGWRRDTLMHGDARQANFVLCRPAADQAELLARMVDWEFIDVGDAAWDCAAVMQHYWQAWSATTPRTPATWEQLQHAIEGFWAAYIMRWDGDSRLVVPTFCYATQMTGARLIQTAYEHLARFGNWTIEIQRYVRLAQLLLTEPAAALSGFGIGRDGP